MPNPERRQDGGSPAPTQSTEGGSDAHEWAGGGERSAQAPRQAAAASAGGADAKSSGSTHLIQTHAHLAPVCLTFIISIHA